MSMVTTRASGFTCSRIIAHRTALPPWAVPASTRTSGFTSKRISWVIQASLGFCWVGMPSHRFRGQVLLSL
jgi:hypothetical protein